MSTKPSQLMPKKSRNPIWKQKGQVRGKNYITALIYFVLRRSVISERP